MEEDEIPYSQSVFLIEVEKIRPNPFQPRREFDQAALASLAESIRQYGVLQPIVVTRLEVERPDGGLAVEYELIAGERRLRASKIAGLRQIPALIRAKKDNDKAKLEIAIIENLQREDLNPVERARAFDRLNKEFNMTHLEIAGKIGKSREYVSNTMRILALPEHILSALESGRISEGHTRPLLMLNDREEERDKLFRQIIEKGVTVREAEHYSRRVAVEKARRPDKIFDYETRELEKQIAERLGTRVWVEKKNDGGKILIEFFSPDDLARFLSYISREKNEGSIEDSLGEGERGIGESVEDKAGAPIGHKSNEDIGDRQDLNDSDDDDLYSVRNFTI